MNGRIAMAAGIILAVLAFFGSLAWVVLDYALPKPNWVEIGSLGDFPPADEPYAISRSVYVYLVNDGQDIFVLDPMNPAPQGVNVRWNPGEQAFIDPVRGSWFDLHGVPVRRGWVNSMVEKQSLRRFAVKVVNNQVFIDLNRSYGEELAEGQ